MEWLSIRETPVRLGHRVRLIRWNDRLGILRGRWRSGHRRWNGPIKYNVRGTYKGIGREKRNHVPRVPGIINDGSIRHRRGWRGLLLGSARALGE
jgi:hypothetical protein